MNFSHKYGEPLRRVIDTHSDHILIEKDEWNDGKLEASLNQQGAFIHRFRRHRNNGNVQNFTEAVRNIVCPSAGHSAVANNTKIIPTCATFVGPSFCRTYAHSVWKYTAGFLFSPNTRITLGYKGDIYTHRLRDVKKRFDDFLINSQNNNSSAFDLASVSYADHITNAFNKININNPTASAFKNHRAKNLSIVVSSNYQQFKISEMEARASFYFLGTGNEPVVDGIDVDRPSKYVIFDLLQRDRIDCSTISKDDLIVKIKDYIEYKPNFAVYLLAPLIKISNFSGDKAVHIYLSKAKSVPYQRTANNSYSFFLRDVKDNPPNRNLLLNNSELDPVTTLTPNEFQLMPRPEDLIGLTLDFRSVDSFSQGIEAMRYLKANATTKSAGDRLAPFLHINSHFKGTSLTQLGWSRMVFPWSKEGLISFATSGKVAAIDSNANSSKFFTPDVFLIFHRIASRAHLNLTHSDEHLIDLLRVYSTIPHDFYTVKSKKGETVVQLAACNELWQRSKGKSILFEGAFELFCFIDALNRINNKMSLSDELFKIKNQADCCQDAKKIADKVYGGDSKSINEGFSVLIEKHVNRIQSLVERNSSVRRELRAGMVDVGHFTYNRELGCISLKNGVRTLANNIVQKGTFRHSSFMREGGAIFVHGIQLTPTGFVRKPRLNFGHFEAGVQLFGFQVNPVNNPCKFEMRLIGKNYSRDLLRIHVEQKSNCSEFLMKSESDNVLRFTGRVINAGLDNEDPGCYLKILLSALCNVNVSKWRNSKPLVVLLNFAFQVHDQFLYYQKNSNNFKSYVVGCSYFNQVGHDLKSILDTTVRILSAAFNGRPDLHNYETIKPFITINNYQNYKRLLPLLDNSAPLAEQVKPNQTPFHTQTSFTAPPNSVTAIQPSVLTQSTSVIPTSAVVSTQQIPAVPTQPAVLPTAISPSRLPGGRANNSFNRHIKNLIYVDKNSVGNDRYEIRFDTNKWSNYKLNNLADIYSLSALPIRPHYTTWLAIVAPINTLRIRKGKVPYEESLGFFNAYIYSKYDFIQFVSVIPWFFDRKDLRPVFTPGKNILPDFIISATKL